MIKVLDYVFLLTTVFGFLLSIGCLKNKKNCQKDDSYPCMIGKH